MPTITFIHPDGRRTGVPATSGQSVMEVATFHGIEEIVAQCGGSQVCATCHVFVAQPDFERLSPRQALEDELLDTTAARRRANSPLICQIEIGTDDLTIILPERQL